MSDRRRIITSRESSLLLDISEATVRNWVRHGYLQPVTESPKAFYYSDVLKIKKQLASGEIRRLNQRANRTRLESTTIPAEYVNDAVLRAQAKQVRDILAACQLGLEPAMFCLTIRLLVLKKEVRLNDPARMFQARAYSGWQRQSVKAEILDWLASSKCFPKKSAEKHLDLYHVVESAAPDDLLGLLYQALRREGRRSRQGMYYTPAELLTGVFAGGSRNRGGFLDPCCGTGRFLTHAARSGGYEPGNLVGFDIDPMAVRIARINLLLVFSDREFTPQIFCLDVLDAKKTRSFQKRFGLIATNPPWGAAVTPAQRVRLKASFPMVSSGESFSYFLAAGLDLLSENGRLSYILPESFLNIRTHRDIRKHLLFSSTLGAVTFWGRRFGGVLSPAIRVDIIKRPPSKKMETRVFFRNGRVHAVPQERFCRNRNYIIDAWMTEQENMVIQKIYKFPHVTLAGKAEWALGIVTGDNRRHLFDGCKKGMEPVYRGKDIEKYRLKKPGVFICFAPERFQQTAPESRYRAGEKLVYRFVSRRLVFALDNTGTLTLNSANVLIPKISGYPVKAVLGVLNSSISQFVFEKKFHSLKALRKDLEFLPLPLLGKDRLCEMVTLVDRALAGEDVAVAIDRLIMSALSLSDQERRIILEAGTYKGT